MMDWEALKERTDACFTASVAVWLDEVKARGADPESAYAALAVYVGHVLAGAALELGVATTPRLALSTAELVEENMADQIADALFKRGGGG